MTLHVAKSCLLPPPLRKAMEDKRYSDYVLDHYNNTTGTRHTAAVKPTLLIDKGNNNLLLWILCIFINRQYKRKAYFTITLKKFRFWKRDNIDFEYNMQITSHNSFRLFWSVWELAYRQTDVHFMLLGFSL